MSKRNNPKSRGQIKAVWIDKHSRHAAKRYSGNTKSKFLNEHQINMEGEAQQAAKENAANPTKDIPRIWTTEMAGGREHYDPVSGATYFESDYDGE